MIMIIIIILTNVARPILKGNLQPKPKTKISNLVLGATTSDCCLLSATKSITAIHPFVIVHHRRRRRFPASSDIFWAVRTSEQ